MVGGWGWILAHIFKTLRAFRRTIPVALCSSGLVGFGYFALCCLVWLGVEWCCLVLLGIAWGFHKFTLNTFFSFPVLLITTTMHLGQNTRSLWTVLDWRFLLGSSGVGDAYMCAKHSAKQCCKALLRFCVSVSSGRASSLLGVAWYCLVLLGVAWKFHKWTHKQIQRPKNGPTGTKSGPKWGPKRTPKGALGPPKAPGALQNELYPMCGRPLDRFRVRFGLALGDQRAPWEVQRELEER